MTKIVLLATALAVVLFLSGCLQQQPELEFSYKEIGIEELESSLCAGYSSGFKQLIWLDSSTADIVACGTINCAQTMGNARYKLDGNKLILEYDVIGEPLADCFDTLELHYKLIGLEKKSYEVELMQCSPAYSCIELS